MKIISYFGNLYFPEFKLHIAEMKHKGFNVILFAITQTDILFNLVIFEEFADYARSEGMAVWATYWGFQGVGEAVNTETSPHNFLKAMKEIGVSEVMIDEPKYLQLIAWFIGDNYFNFNLCLSDDVFNKLSDEQIKTMPVNMLGVSCYHMGHRDWQKVRLRTERVTERLRILIPKNNFIFIQGFDIPSEMDRIPLVVRQIAESNGIVNLGFWSFRGTVTGTKRSVNRQQIWDSIKW